MLLGKLRRDSRSHRGQPSEPWLFKLARCLGVPAAALPRSNDRDYWTSGSIGSLERRLLLHARHAPPEWRGRPVVRAATW